MRSPVLQPWTLTQPPETKPMSATLYYAVDPMCSWCWGFKPTWTALCKELPSTINVRNIMGGLAPDSDDPMPQDMQVYLQQTWQRIETTIPGTRFNFDFWTTNTPRRSTYPSCRAVLAARMQSREFENPMLLAIQTAYYLDAKNPSDIPVLIELAGTIGCDVEQFTNDIKSAEVNELLHTEMQFARTLGAQGFPSLIFESLNGSRHVLNIGFGDSTRILEQVESLIVG